MINTVRTTTQTATAIRAATVLSVAGMGWTVLRTYHSVWHLAS